MFSLNSQYEFFKVFNANLKINECDGNLFLIMKNDGELNDVGRLKVESVLVAEA